MSAVFAYLAVGVVAAVTIVMVVAPMVMLKQAFATRLPRARVRKR